MDNCNINSIFDREKTATEIKKILSSFEDNCKNITFKKGIYIYGAPGCGKTQFVQNILKELDYDSIKYDAGDVRNKALIDTITSNNISNKNVLHMMSRKVKKIAIVMDEIDGMNNGDKGGITALIKIIRQKKTKKQRLENLTMNPIICIGNYYIDKKIKELMKVCTIFELKTPTKPQMTTLLNKIIPTVQKKTILLDYIQGDMRKLSFVIDLFKNNPEILTESVLKSIFQTKSYNEDSKKITQHLIHTNVPMENHNQIMNETDRTIVALLWHENVVDILQHDPIQTSLPVYLQILNNICYADYIDRITFQNQIWQFNEMSSLMKTMYNNKIYHTYRETTSQANRSTDLDIRFTKVLTKYSTEYNNVLFIYNLCQELDLDKKDMTAMFQELRLFYQGDFCNKNDVLASVEKIFEQYKITKLDIKRIYRYLDKNIKKDAADMEEDVDGSED